MNTGRRACCILVYFGHFNCYFQQWLNSCAINKTIDWLIVTDDKSQFYLPQNARLIYTGFKDVQDKIYSIWGRNVRIETPYDLCVYRVAYHRIFPELITGYDYWGFCDCDLIWGNISVAIEEPMQNGFDKISWRGHFTLFRNDETINDVYTKEVDGIYSFRDAISRTPKNHLNLFDEVGINLLFDHYRLKTYKGLLFANLKVKYKNFRCSLFSDKEEFKNKNQIFEWNNGTLYRIYAHNDELHKEEFVYVHFLKRHISNSLSSHSSDHFLIIPNRIIDYEPITLEKVLKWSKDGFYADYYKRRLNTKRILSKITSVVKEFFHPIIPDHYDFVIK